MTSAKKSLAFLLSVFMLFAFLGAFPVSAADDIAVDVMIVKINPLTDYNGAEYAGYSFFSCVLTPYNASVEEYEWNVYYKGTQTPADGLNIIEFSDNPEYFAVELTGDTEYDVVCNLTGADAYSDAQAIVQYPFELAESADTRALNNAYKDRAMPFGFIYEENSFGEYEKYYNLAAQLLSTHKPLKSSVVGATDALIAAKEALAPRSEPWFMVIYYLFTAIWPAISFMFPQI